MNTKRVRITQPLEEYLLPGAELRISKAATIRKSHVKDMIDAWGDSAKITVVDGGDMLVDRSAAMSRFELDRFRTKLAASRPPDVSSESLSELVATADRADWEEVLLALARCFDLVDEEPFVKKLRNTGVRVAVGIVSGMYLCQLRTFVACEFVDDVHVFPSDDGKIHILVDVKKKEPISIQ